MSTQMNVGIYVFEGMTMLDGYAPLPILSFVEQFNTFTFSRDGRPVKSDSNTVLRLITVSMTVRHWTSWSCPAAVIFSAR